MKFPYGSALFTAVVPSLVLAIACGSASDNWFSAQGSVSDQPGSDGGVAAEVAGSNASGAGGSSSIGGRAAGGTRANDSGEAGSVQGGSISAGGAIAPAGGMPSGSAGLSGVPPSTGAGMAGSDVESAGAGGASACPVNLPTADRDCNVLTPESCFYSGVSCSCLETRGQNQNQQRRWGCYGTPARCPAAEPSTGEACRMNVGAQCPYPGNNFCACVAGLGNGAEWECQGQAVACPLQRPAEGLTCRNVRACQYSEVQCFCDGTNWGCEGG